MGICKCKKRTDLFCFVHKKAVCENCIATDHKTCVVKTYVEWLTDSDYEPGTCNICKGELTEENSLRLLCLDVFHYECLDVYAASLPPHTAKAGYLCPVCNKSIIPTEDTQTNNKLATELCSHLQQSKWARGHMSGNISQHSNNNNNDEEKKTITPNNTQERENNNNNNNNNNDNYETTISPSTPGIAVRKSERKTPVVSTITNNVSTTNRDHSVYINVQNDQEEDEDKYKKRNFAQLLTALGFMKSTANAGRKSRARIRLDTRRLLILFALFICLMTVFIMGMNVMSSEEEIESNNSVSVDSPNQ